MAREIRVIMKRVNEKPFVRIVKNELMSLQGVVGGYIEVVRLDNKVRLVCDEEGKLKGCEPNVLIPGDIVHGDIFFCSGSDGEFNSLSDDQIAFVESYLQEWSIWKL